MSHNKQNAVTQAKKKLGGKVKKQGLHHFDAWRTISPAARIKGVRSAGLAPTQRTIRR